MPQSSPIAEDEARGPEWAGRLRSATASPSAAASGTPGPVELPIPAEPADLRADVQRDPDRAAPIDELVVPILWEAWGETLAAEAGLREIAHGYRYELWLWAMGERSWQQCAEGLAGRVRRRL